MFFVFLLSCTVFPYSSTYIALEPFKGCKRVPIKSGFSDIVRKAVPIVEIGVVYNDVIAMLDPNNNMVGTGEPTHANVGHNEGLRTRLVWTGSW